MLYLTEADVRELANVAEVIDVVERALAAHGRGSIVNNPRRRLHLPEAVLMSMEAADAGDGFVAHKNYLAVPGKRVLSHLFLYDSRHHAMVACMQANELGRTRTGAASAVAAKHLARSALSRHAVFGAGYQAEAQVLALQHVRPIRQIRVWSRTMERAQAFCDRLSPQLDGVEIAPAVDDPAELASWGDVVTVATRASEPVLFGDWLRAGTFVNAVGSNALSRREVDTEVVARADHVVVDAVDVAQRDAGDLLPAIDQGRLLWSQVKPLSMIVADVLSGRQHDDEIILYESQGLALEDLAIGRYLFEQAKRTGVGREIDVV